MNARLLGRSWWVIFPLFAALSVRLAVERACGDPYELLPALTSNARWAWGVALVYVLAHVWFVGAYLVTVSRTGTLLPALAAWRGVWRMDAVKIAGMAVLLAIESAPVAIWRMLAPAIGCAR